jgi:hypothetical protein
MGGKLVSIQGRYSRKRGQQACRACRESFGQRGPYGLITEETSSEVWTHETAAGTWPVDQHGLRTVAVHQPTADIKRDDL